MKTAVYIARIANLESKGIINKVKNTAAALTENSCKTEAVVFNEPWYTGTFKVALRILIAKEDLIILRSDHHTILFFLLPLLWARIRNTKIIIDVANPVRVAYLETVGDKRGPFIRTLKRALLSLSYPLALLPAHRILQYGEDAPRYIWMVKNRVKVVGNGVNLKIVPFRKEKPRFNGDELKFAGSAHLAYWHGYDRLIQAIADYNKRQENNPNRIHFTFLIIGEGFERNKLEALSNQLGVKADIEFTGLKEVYEMDQYFTDVHLAVSSLGTHRKHIYSVSDLKCRDFVARGIPFIKSFHDPDFDEVSDTFFLCTSDESPINLEEIFNWYKELDSKYLSFDYLRKFAEEKLSYDVKVKNDFLDVL